MGKLGIEFKKLIRDKKGILIRDVLKFGEHAFKFFQKQNGHPSVIFTKDKSGFGIPIIIADKENTKDTELGELLSGSLLFSWQKLKEGYEYVYFILHGRIEAYVYGLICGGITYPDETLIGYPFDLFIKGFCYNFPPNARFYNIVSKVLIENPKQFESIIGNPIFKEFK